MSQENVEVVRRVYEAAARRDTATILALYDPKVELDASRLDFGGLIGDPVRHGHEGMLSFFRELNEAWDSPPEYDVEDLEDRGEHVVSVVTRRGVGRASGAEVDFHTALAWTVRDGRVVRLTWFPTRAEALEAVGLSE
jgi:ketosteroid isomerase-like protein